MMHLYAYRCAEGLSLQQIGCVSTTNCTVEKVMKRDKVEELVGVGSCLQSNAGTGSGE